MIEREIKAILSKDMYESVINHQNFMYLNRTSYMQMNYYYETRDFTLFQEGVTLRVRQKDTSMKLEMKYPIEDKGTYKVKRELSIPIDTLPFSFDIEHEFEGTPYKGHVSLIQPLVTERTSIKFSENIRLDIDKSSYLGVTDYELEIEFNQDDYHAAYELCKSLIPIEQIQSSPGKNSRFFQQYFKLRNEGGSS